MSATRQLRCRTSALVAAIAGLALVAAGCAAPAETLAVPAGSGVAELPSASPGPTTPGATPWLTPSKSPTPTPTPTSAGGSGTSGGGSDGSSGGSGSFDPSTGAVSVSSSAFGMHVEQRDSGAWPDIPVGAYRIWNADSTWGSLEPSPGAWNFGPLDTRVANAEARGASVLLVLGHPPAWAATRPDLSAYGGSPSPPADINTWRTYVRTVASRYAGRIDGYEVWNEANLVQFYTGSPQQLADLTIAASQEINAVDGGARVVSSGLSARTGGADSFFRSYLGAVPSSAVDVVGIHVYPYPGNGPESMLGLVSDFRAMASSAGHGGKPMWNTEIGYGRTPDYMYSGDAAAALILRTYLVLPAYGLSRNYWYKWDDREWVGLYLVNSDRSSASEAGLDYGTAARWLAGTTILGCGESNDFWRCDVDRGGTEVSIVWRVSGEATYAAPPGTNVMYRFGGGPDGVSAGGGVSVGTLPVLFAPTELSGLAADIRLPARCELDAARSRLRLG